MHRAVPHERPILLIGSNGQVGRSLRRALSEQRRAEKLWLASRSPLGAREISVELSDPEAIRACLQEYISAAGLAERPPKKEIQGIVILCGAFTHVDGCETDPQRCDQVNHQATKIVADYCAEWALHLLFFSSEYVFGGAEYESPNAVGPFGETDPVAPCSAYGRAKADSEAYILAREEFLSAAIIRTTVVYSWEATDKNFAMQLFRYLSNRLRGAEYAGVPEQFRIPTDQISTPTYAPALALATIELADRGASGIYHLVGTDCLSRADFAWKLIDLFGFSRKEAEQHLEFLPTKALAQPARRPLTAGLKTEKASSAGLPIWTLAEAFADYARFSLER